MVELGSELARLFGAATSDDRERERLLDVAREEFIQHGFRRTAIGDIAGRAGVSRPTIYRRCGDKDDIVLAVVVRDVVQFFVGISDQVMSKPSPGERAVEAFVAGMRECRTHPLVAAIRKFEPETLTTLLSGDRDAAVTPVRTVIALALADETLPFEAAEAAAELMIRITASLLVSPTDVLPVDTDERARAFARAYFVPLITAAGDTARAAGTRR